MDTSSITQQLQKKGYRHSKNRCAILEILNEYMQPISIPEVLIRLKKQGITINKTTAYREIEVLAKENIIHEIVLGDRMKRYEFIPSDHHHHLICTECKSVEDIILDRDVEFAERYISLRKRFKVTNHSLEFYGICRSCQ